MQFSSMTALAPTTTSGPISTLYGEITAPGQITAVLSITVAFFADFSTKRLCASKKTPLGFSAVTTPLT